MSKKIKFSHRLMGFGGYDVDVKNTAKGIELSNITPIPYGNDKPNIRPSEVVIDLLQDFKRPYSDIRLREGVDGKKQLAITIKEDIAELESQIEIKKLALKMCKRKNVFFKEEKL